MMDCHKHFHGKQIHRILRGQLAPGSCESFREIMHTNTFMTSKPISLCGAGFFGPADEPEGTYRILFELEEVQVHKISLLHSYKVAINAKQNEIFWLYFPDAVPLRPGIYYRLRFILDGPNTGVLNVRTLKTSIIGDADIHFEYLGGSKQMPALAYLID